MNRPKRKMGISASSYTQFTDCQRKWYIGYIIKPDVPKTPALQTGIDVHDWLEAYLKGEELPDIGEKLVNIAKAGLEYLPEPGTVNVEEWVEDVCGPLPFRGKVDFYTCEDGILHISDHKTTSRSSNAKTEAELALNPQMLAYAYVLARKLEIQPTKIKFSHIYYLTKSKIATSFRVDAEAKWSDVEKNWKDFERVAKVMARLAKAEHQKAIMPDVSKCRFCWFKEHCEAYPKKDKKTKPKTKSKSGESDMDIMNKIREQKAKQAAAKLAKAKADADLANLELQAATAEVADIDHPLAPTESIDWKKLGDLLIEAIEEREAEGDLFMKATLFEFLEFQLDREIKQEDADNLMEACGHRLVQGDNYISVVKEETMVEGGLSDYIDQMLKHKSTRNLPKGWTLTQVENFWKKVLMGLSSTPILDDITTRTMAKEASSGTRLPRSSTIKALVAWVLECNVPIELAAEDCALRLGVSKHEQEMADKLGALLPSAPKPEKVEEPKPEKVEEPKTHLKPVGKLEADLVVTTSPEPTTADTPVIVYVNAFPSDHIPTKLSAVLEPLQEEVAEEHGLPYYHLVKYEKGPSHVVSKVLALLNGCHASKLLGKSVFASQKDPCLAELLPILERRDDVVIVRGFIG